MKIVVIVLTYNEAQHISRCLLSVRGLASQIYVVDSYSTDETVALAKSHGASVLYNKFSNQASQFNWALDQLKLSNTWILRLDADEYLESGSHEKIIEAISCDKVTSNGFALNRTATFMGRAIKYGGIYPIKVVRMFRAGSGRYENRWMDEHLQIEGAIGELDCLIIDDNCKSISWWISKHNNYASREAIEIINYQYNFLQKNSNENRYSHSLTISLKNLIKKHIYCRLPLGTGPLLYFIYRYFVRFGFLDGFAGFAFHFLQGFWYRTLVDIKVFELKIALRDDSQSIRSIILSKFSIDIGQDGPL